LLAVVVGFCCEKKKKKKKKKKKNEDLDTIQKNRDSTIPRSRDSGMEFHDPRSHDPAIGSDDSGIPIPRFRLGIAKKKQKTA